MTLGERENALCAHEHSPGCHHVTLSRTVHDLLHGVLAGVISSLFSSSFFSLGWSMFS